MLDMSRWDLDERGLPTFVAAQSFSVAAIPGTGGGILRLEYATTYENALAGIFETRQIFLFREQAQAVADDLRKLAGSLEAEPATSASDFTGGTSADADC